MVRAIWLVFLLCLYALLADDSEKTHQQEAQNALENSRGGITQYVTQLRVLQAMLEISQPAVGNQLAVMMYHMEGIHKYEGKPSRHIEAKIEEGQKVTFSVSPLMWMRMHRSAHLFQPLHLPPGSPFSLPPAFPLSTPSSSQEEREQTDANEEEPDDDFSSSSSQETEDEEVEDDDFGATEENTPEHVSDEANEQDVATQGEQAGSLPPTVRFDQKHSLSESSLPPETLKRLAIDGAHTPPSSAEVSSISPTSEDSETSSPSSTLASRACTESEPDTHQDTHISSPDAFSETPNQEVGSTPLSDTPPQADSPSLSSSEEPASSVVASPSSSLSSSSESTVESSVDTSALSSDFSSSSHVSEAENTLESKRESIVKEFLHAWGAYERHAWGQDDLNPVSKRGTHSYNMSLLMVDSLDTLLVMGLHAQFNRSRDYLLTHLNFTHQKGVNLFETTIRVVGGLLSAYALSGDARLLGMAESLADRMLFAFNTPTGLPVGTLDLEWQNGTNPAWIGGKSTTAEVGSLQLEFQYLSFVTSNKSFASRVNRVSKHLESLDRGLYTQYIDPADGKMSATTITVGARVDSVYEYFLKQHLMWPGTEEGDRGLRMYRRSIQAMLDVLLEYSEKRHLAYIAERTTNNQNVGKMDHLVCFVPGMLALGARTYGEDNLTAARHMEIAAELMKTCVEFYSSPTGLAPEIAQFMTHSPFDLYVDPGSAHSLLRPETVESLFVLWRLTHNPIYREWGWEIFTSIRTWARVCHGGYSGLRDVRVTTGKKDCAEGIDCSDCGWENWNDHMESFFLAETMKYLYLLFSEDDVLSLDKFVFNTEAHPLPKFGMTLCPQPS